MCPKKISFVLLSFVITVGAPWSNISAQELIDKVVASIEGEPITRSEVVRHASGQGKDVKGVAQNDPRFSAALQEVVVQRLLNREAEALKISVSNEEVETYLSEIRRQNSVDEDSFKELVAKRGIKWENYLAQIRTDIIKNRVVSSRVRSKINVVDEDIARYLEEQPGLRPSIGSRRVFEIDFAGSDKAASAKHQELEAAIASQTEFDVRSLIKLGARDLGYVAAEDLRSEISKVLAETKDAELSELINLDLRMVSYYVVGTITADTPVDQVLSKEISAKVYEKKFNDKLQEFIDVELPARYHVEQL